MKMVKCRHCFAGIPTGANRCRHCGGKQHLVLPTIVLLVFLVVVLFFVWHLFVVDEIKNRLSSQDISLNPFTNTITITTASSASSDTAFLAGVLGTSLAAKLVGPVLAEKFNDHAKERFDLYAMIIPWKVEFVLHPW